MALRITDRLITSDITPDTAQEIADGHWFLSWLPDHSLTREQAVSGMVLDEILSDPEPDEPRFAMELAVMRAEMLGLDLRDVIVRLSIRVVQRDLARSGPQPNATPCLEIASCSPQA
ncbi:hypothetical protein [Nocardia crassostreae]|uniref:hypothetical protein n=1 Tax=Nocardia crassostreae TaxID=53428 RepID=UPI0008371C6E|nr:hypothetical protein [Nocardia crassostreae]